MFKIKTLNNISPIGLKVLEDYGCEVGDNVKNPQAILVRSADMLDYEFNPELLCIARAGVGTNNIPIDRATKEGICVFNTPGANAEAVKELVICALLMSSRDIVGGIEWVSSISGSTDIPAMVEKGKSSFAGPEISGKTLGVVGLGAIGAKIANAALGLGMEVYGYDPYLSVDAAWQLSSKVIHANDLDDVLKNCDYITLHVPYLKETHHMFNAQAFAKMRDGVRIINIARGELVSNEALLDALDSAKVARYVTDFPNEEVVGVPNVVCMPHLGASTPESEDKCAEMAAKQLYEYLLRGNVRNSVNFPGASLERMGVSRLCAIHRNVPRMIHRILNMLVEKDINVEHMLNKPRGEYAYTIIDTDIELSPVVIGRINAMDEILGVRTI